MSGDEEVNSSTLKVCWYLVSWAASEWYFNDTIHLLSWETVHVHILIHVNIHMYSYKFEYKFLWTKESTVQDFPTLAAADPSCT